PDWRPNTDYKKSYSAKKEEGGGVSIDLIHEWDYLIYLFGFPQEVYNLQGKFSHLDINSEDLESAINATLERRFTRYSEDHPIFMKEFAKNEIKQIQWKAFLKKINSNDDVPERFDEVAGFIMKELYPYWIRRKEE
ncbi:Gfo/Idh/MocA family oxidoreductase, partial [uncultured Proteiniphilum sp.]|uniref:Gfo/Idh/MocA family oxidoreductase n=1 Tax=uncultured Proteiniphilum sp. TaxID=497637 RepID=UPI002617AF7B